MTRTISTFALFCVLLLASFAVACEKNNDLVAQQQIEDAKKGCPEGCEIPPPGCAIKGNISDMGNKFFHVPGGYYYDGVIVDPAKGERWFCTEDEATSNGWKKSFR
jgi:hypothetical protein